MSLLPEKPLIISPSLAATLGLEEAVLLHVLSDLMAHTTPEQAYNQPDWFSTNLGQLQHFLPFWHATDIQRIATSLRDKGVLLIGSAPITESQQLRFAIDANIVASPQMEASPTPSIPAKAMPTKGTQLIPNRWQPCEDTVRQLAQYNIPHQFCEQQIPEFVTYWHERNEPQYSWGSKFIKQVLRAWRGQESKLAKQNQQAMMHDQWHPSSDALDILTRQAAINPNFVEDAIPEFILYWQERGEPSSTWNTRFISHVKRQWARYTSTMEQDTEPRPLPANWQPSESLFDVLSLANISRAFAEQQVPEFILYWGESGQVYGSWNTRFLQQVKKQWAKHCHLQQDNNHERQQFTHQRVRTRDRSLEEDLNDRSWAQ